MIVWVPVCVWGKRSALNEELGSQMEKLLCGFAPGELLQAP